MIPPTAKSEPSRTAYLVLGMHRSGTSAMTQLLALAGADLPRNLMPGDEHNAQGYFEPWRIALFNDERLRAAGSAWEDVFAYPFRPLPRRTERRWENRAEALFGEEFGRLAHPLLKDPRVTVLAPLWRAVLEKLEVGARCVIPVRHPLAVAGSLARRNGFAPQKSVLLWTTYMLAAEAYSRDLPRALVDYDRLLSDWRTEAGRIEAAHGAALPNLDGRAAQAIDKALTPELRHNPSDGDLEALGWAGALAGRVFAWFRAAAADEAPDATPLAEAAADLVRRAKEVGTLVSPASCEVDRLRTELRETRARLELESAERAHLQSEVRTFQRAFETAEAEIAAALSEP
jgi:hypothetical protein